MIIRRILVIDDDPHLISVIQLCLQTLRNWTVTSAKCGIEGLHLAETVQPDVILLDMRLPDLDGLAVWEKLQHSPLTDRIPVILLTAQATSEDRQQYQKLSLAGVLSKPFDPFQLPDLIDAALQAYA